MALVDQVTAAVETYCGIKIAQDTVVQTFDGNVDELVLKIGPAVSVTSITDKDNSNSTVTASTYSLDTELSAIYKENGDKWGSSRSRQRWTVTYVAGYSSVPEDLQLAIDTWVDYLTNSPSGSLKSYTTGDDSETYMDVEEMPNTVMGLLQKYRRIVYWH